MQHDISRVKLQDYANYLKDDQLCKLAQSDIFWATVSSIEEVGVHETYDIQIDSENHLYALDGFITHNSTLLESIYWAQFNDTLRSDMKADWVVNDKVGKNCRVKLDYRNGYSIERFRKHRDLGGTGVKVYKDGIYQEK